jgi:hypothetical protein
MREGLSGCYANALDNLCRPSGACAWSGGFRGLSPPANFGLTLRVKLAAGEVEHGKLRIAECRLRNGREELQGAVDFVVEAVDVAVAGEGDELDFAGIAGLETDGGAGGDIEAEAA